MGFNQNMVWKMGLIGAPTLPSLQDLFEILANRVLLDIKRLAAPYVLIPVKALLLVFSKVLQLTGVSLRLCKSCGKNFKT